MPIKCDSVLYSVIREEHMIHNDIFLRYLEFDGEPLPSALVFTCGAEGRELLRLRYGPEEIAARLAYAREELPRYRDSSLRRILGLDYRPEQAFLHEHFSFFASGAVDELRIEADCGGKIVTCAIPVIPYKSPNRWRFPLSGTVVVTDTYSSINSHRWCRNSEFAFDAGAFDETLGRPVIGGRPVYAACDGVVEETFDGLEDTDDGTDLAEIETRYGEHARIDGNHVILRHSDNELSLYAHLQKGSVAVTPGEAVKAGQLIGRVGSSGSSWIPHLHFHVMRDGIEGPGVPVVFEDLRTILGEPCLLEDTVNLVRAEDGADPGRITLELLTQDNLDEARRIDRSDVPEDFVDTVDELMELTRYGLEHGCAGHTFLARQGGVCAGVLLLGEAIPWDTDPEEMRERPFYRLMGFVIDRRFRDRGVGAYVLDEAVRRVYDEFGPRPIALGCHRDNEDGARFWIRQGFRPTAAMEGEDVYYIREL